LLEATTAGDGTDLVTFGFLLRREDEQGNNDSCNDVGSFLVVKEDGQRVGPEVVSFLTAIEEDDDGARVVTVVVEEDGQRVGHEEVCFNFLRRNRSPSFFRYFASMVSLTKSASRLVHSALLIE